MRKAVQNCDLTSSRASKTIFPSKKENSSDFNKIIKV
jgi:hypothetical protein